MTQAVVYTNRVQEVPKEQHSPAFRLFHYYYRVMVQQMFTMDAAVAAQWGSPTSGNPDWDREMRNAWVEVQLTPVEMVALLQRGAALEFHDEQQATTIYLDLVAHLRGWLKAFETNPNLRRAPLEDFRLFDELAGQIYPYASAVLMANEDDAGYGAFLARRSRRRGSAAILSSRTAEGNTDASRGVYRPLSEAIAERLVKRNS